MYLIKYAPIFLEPATVSCSCERFHKFSEKSSSNGLFFNRRERWMGVLPKYLPLNSSFQFTTPLGSYNHAILSQCVLSLSQSLSVSQFIHSWSHLWTLSASFYHIIHELYSLLHATHIDNFSVKQILHTISNYSPLIHGYIRKKKELKHQSVKI